MDELRIRLGSWLEGVATRLDRADALLERTAAGSWRQWLRLIAASLGASVVLVLLLHLVVAGLFAAGPGPRWTAVVLAAGVAAILQVIVVRNVVISIAEPGRRRFLLIASLVAVAALLTSVAAFATATAAVRSMPLWTAERMYLWQLADSVPLLAIPRRLQWTEAALTGGVGARLTLLAFKIVVIAPLVRLVVAFYEVVEAQRTDPAARPRPPGKLIFRVTRVRGLTPAVAAAGFLWGALGPGTKLGHQIGGLPASARVAAVALMVLAVVTAGPYWGVLLTLVEALIGLVVAPGVLAFAAVVGLVWFDTPVRRAALPFMSAGGLAAKLSMTVVLGTIAVIVVTRLWILDEPTSVAFFLLLGFVGTTAPGRVWLLTEVRAAPVGLALGRGLATSAVWFALAYLVVRLGQLPASAARAGGIDTRYHPGWLRHRLQRYLNSALQILCAAAAALVALHGTATLGLLPQTPARPCTGGFVLGCAPGVEAWPAFVDAAWNVADAIPGPDIPAVLDWRLATTVPSRAAGLVLLLTILAVALLAAFPAVRSILGWARWRAGAAADPIGLRAPEQLVRHLWGVVDFVVSEPADADDRSPLAGSRRARIAEAELALAERAYTALRERWNEGTPMHTSATEAIQLVRSAYAATLAGTRDGYEQLAAQIFVEDLETYVARWSDAFALAGGETRPDPPLDPFDLAGATEDVLLALASRRDAGPGPGTGLDDGEPPALPRR
ncbi:hypothetical protein [Hamadaea tsunoensis]|uniref:hypothetical protein n=1 Tax=Hamadaea tsunoensis TaxID=53368 RepID=UPI0003FF45A8|nr:hypothetical protein [Hamadaea tsunoensis]